MRKRTEKQMAVDALFRTIANNDALFDQMELPELRTVCQGTMKSTLYMANLLDEVAEELEQLHERLKKLEEQWQKNEVSPSPQSTE
jgi:hypothetical protein